MNIDIVFRVNHPNDRIILKSVGIDETEKILVIEMESLKS